MIGENIKRIREEQNLTQKQLAQRLGINPVAVSQYESNRTNIKIETLERIAEALNVRLSDLTEQHNVEHLTHNVRITRMLNLFNDLNEKGQKEALRTLKLLNEIERFKN